MAYLLIAGFLGLVLSIVLTIVFKRDARNDPEVPWRWHSMDERSTGEGCVWIAFFDRKHGTVRVEVRNMEHLGLTWNWPPSDAIGWKPCQPPIFSDWKLKNEWLASR